MLHRSLLTASLFMVCFGEFYFQAIFSSASAEEPKPSAIMEQLELDSGGKTPVVKQFPQSFPEVLHERGQPIVYTRENSANFEYIGMPVGGIGAGQLYLGGDGQLWFWDIFGLNYKMGQLKGEEAYEFPYTRSNPTEKGARQLVQGFSVSIKSGDQWVDKTLNRDGIEEIQFRGQYPIGEVTYRDAELPLEISLEAFSPFIPLDVDNSSLPATVMEFTVRNASSRDVDVRLKGWLENAVLVQSRRDQNLGLRGKLKNLASPLPGGGVRVDCSAEVTDGSEKTNALTDFGTMSLALLGDGVTAEQGAAAIDLSSSEMLVARLQKSWTLAPGESQTATFVLTWNFPTTRALYIGKYRRADQKAINYLNTNDYARRFEDAAAVSEYLIANFQMLAGTTRLWRDTWYDSTLPWWFLDRTFLNTSILASSTSNLVDDGLFYGTEGGNQGEGTVTHVWGYVQAMGRLFPDLEKSLREKVDFVPVEDGGALTPEGVIRYRWRDDKPHKSLAVDGQCGVILRAYLAHQMSTDNTFLRRIYPGMKKAMQGLIELRDADHDGILTGAQHNTLDGIWYGKVTWLSLHYTTALRAMAEMADEMGDVDYASFCRATADKGRKYIEEELFNGEYFIHQGNPEKPNSPGTYNGLEYSQLLGQSWAYQVGLGQVADPKKVKTALQSIWRYNFSTDVGPFRERFKPGRWYAMPGEGGLIACTWPRGGSEVLDKGNPRFAAYNNECQNGYEYAASSLMMWHDMPYHSLAHLWYMHNDRYLGSKRNPWCEVEWGIHYSRSMASYGHFTAAGGFEYDGPKKYIAFAPNVTPDDFRSAFVGAEGWGTFQQQRSATSLDASIELRFGQLGIKTIALELAPGHRPESVTLTHSNGSAIAHRFEIEQQRMVIEMPEPLLVGKNESLCIEIR